MSHHIVQLSGVSYVYPDGTKALHDVSLTITHGEAVAVVGANGAGKSTLLLHLNGCLSPSSGSVRIGDLPIGPSTLTHVRRTVGMVFQDPDDQLFMPTVGDDVAFGPFHLGLRGQELEQRVQKTLSHLGIAHLKNRPPHRLSGGEKRRTAFATVLAMAPDILVLDEPTTGLDPRGRRQIISLLMSFTHTRIIATHDLELVLEICPRTVVMDKGRVRADGPTRDIFRDKDLLEECGLEQPTSLRSCPLCGASQTPPSTAPP